MSRADLIIRTERLELVAATLEHLQAEIARPRQLGPLLRAVVPPDWPPGEYDESAMAYFRERYLAEGEAARGWYNWYALLPTLGSDPTTLIGSTGYFGPPNPRGTVEIGYSVLTEYRGRGYAGEMARALVDRAAADERVRRIIARTRGENLASISVLRRCGLSAAGPGEEPGILIFERLLTRAAPPERR